MHVAPDAPHQRDGCSCGVFLMATLDLLMQGLLPPYAFSQADIPKIRLGIAAHLLHDRIP